MTYIVDNLECMLAETWIFGIDKPCQNFKGGQNFEIAHHSAPVFTVHSATVRETRQCFETTCAFWKYIMACR